MPEFENGFHSLAQLFGDLVFKLIRTTQSRNLDTTQWAGMLVLFFNEPQRTTHNQEGRNNMNAYNTTMELIQGATKMIQPAKLKGAGEELVEVTSGAVQPQLKFAEKSVIDLSSSASPFVPSAHDISSAIDVDYTVVDDAAEALVSNARKPQPYRFAKDNGLVNAEYAGTQPNAVSKAGTDGVVRIPKSSITDAVPQTWGDRIQRAATDAKNNIVSTGNKLRTYTDEQIKAMADASGRTLDEMKAFTTQNPEAAVGIAVSSGVVVGGVGTAAAVS